MSATRVQRDDGTEPGPPAVCRKDVRLATSSAEVLRSRLLLEAAYRDLPLAGVVLRRRGAVRGVARRSRLERRRNGRRREHAVGAPEHALALRGTITNGDSVDSLPVCR